MKTLINILTVLVFLALEGFFIFGAWINSVAGNTFWVIYDLVHVLVLFPFLLAVIWGEVNRK